MAQLTNGGDIVSSGPGLPGFDRSYHLFDQWLGKHLVSQRDKLKALQTGSIGGGGGSHGQAWNDGYDLGKHNALGVVERAFGDTSGVTVKPAPAAGTDKRAGYDAGVTAALLAVQAI